MAVARYSVGAVVLSAIAIAAQPNSVPPLVTTLTTIDRDVPGLMRQAHVAGLALAVIDGGKVVAVKGFGRVKADVDAPVTESTRFEAASLSKPVTAYVALQLVDAGKLKLDTPLIAYVKYADLPDDPRAAQITARHVLSHQTGFANWRRRDPLKMFFAPGDRFSYSGEGYVYLQRALEAISGESLEALAARLVFRPLGMTRSSYLHPGIDQVAWKHTDIGIPLPPLPSPPGPNAAASLVTTAGDYGRFIVAALGGERLRPETFRMMLTPQVQLAGCTACTDKPATQRSRDLAWGFGWGLEESSVGRTAWHWGDNPGFKNYVAVSLSARRGFVYFANSDSGLALRDSLTAMILGGTHPAASLLEYRQLGSAGGGRGLLASSKR